MKKWGEIFEKLFDKNGSNQQKTKTTTKRGERHDVLTLIVYLAQFEVGGHLNYRFSPPVHMRRRIVASVSPWCRHVSVTGIVKNRQNVRQSCQPLSPET